MSIAEFYKLQAARTLARREAQHVTQKMCRSASANPARAMTVSYPNPHFEIKTQITEPRSTRAAELRASSATRRFLTSERQFEREQVKKATISEVRQRDTCYRLYEQGYDDILKKEAINAQSGREYPYTPRVNSNAKPRYFDYIRKQDEQRRKQIEREQREARSGSVMNERVVENSRRIYEKQHVSRINAQNKAFEEREQREAPDYPFRPRIDGKSRELTKNQDPFLAKIDMQIQVENQRKKTLITQNELRELEECPFKPEINDKFPREAGSVFDRLYTEGMQRLATIQAACEQAAAQSVAEATSECTFVPRISENAGMLSAQRAARIIYTENAKQRAQSPAELEGDAVAPAVSLGLCSSSANEQANEEIPRRKIRSGSNLGVYEKGIELNERKERLQELNESTACLLANSTHCSDKSEVIASERVDRFLRNVFQLLEEDQVVGCLQLNKVQGLSCEFSAKKLISEILIENAAGIDLETFKAAFLMGIKTATQRGEQINISEMGSVL